MSCWTVGRVDGVTLSQLNAVVEKERHVMVVVAGEAHRSAQVKWLTEGMEGKGPQILPRTIRKFMSRPTSMFVWTAEEENSIRSQGGRLTSRNG